MPSGSTSVLRSASQRSAPATSSFNTTKKRCVRFLESVATTTASLDPWRPPTPRREAGPGRSLSSSRNSSRDSRIESSCGSGMAQGKCDSELEVAARAVKSAGGLRDGPIRGRTLALTPLVHSDKLYKKMGGRHADGEN